MIKEPSEEMIIDLVNSFEHRNILTALEVELSLDLMKECRERKRLKKIIKEAKEYIEEYQEVLKEHNGDWLNYQDGFKPYLLEILDKGE